jgi:uncharacterized protein
MDKLTIISDTKNKAVKEFTRQLIASEAGKDVIKVILFGSVAKGDAKEESDIDLLVFASNSLDKVSDVCAEVSFQTWIKYHQAVEPLVYCIDALRFSNSSFIEQVLRNGQEVYGMAEDKKLKIEARGYLSLAEHYLDGAKRNMSVGDFRVCIDTAYNSCELCAKALILLKGEDIPGSHGGVVNRFGELYILSGEMAKEFGRRLNRYLELRNKARYDPHADVTPESAKGTIEMSEEMVEFLGSRLA